ncbi:transcriptional regulator [Halobaculum sp. MBLA0147]|uniref:HVO_A0114 family putative DNA-binding protein n=1 Tax=Halobaculum sp. MBLA0147 TaxID=3079934 RepID=UPI00352621CD
MSEPVDHEPSESGRSVPTPDESSTDRTLLRTEYARLLSAEGYGDVRVLSHEAAERVFTERRRELLRVLDEFDVSSQRELARLVDRDPGAVQRDLQTLIEFDLVSLADDGRANRPVLAYDTVVVEPLVAPDTVVPEASFTPDDEP